MGPPGEPARPSQGRTAPERGLGHLHCDVDIDAIAHGLGYHAEVFEELEAAPEATLITRSNLWVQPHSYAAHAQAPAVVSPPRHFNLCPKAPHVDMGFAKAEQQARTQTIADRGAKDSRSIWSRARAERFGFVHDEAPPSVPEVSPEAIALLQFEDHHLTVLHDISINARVLCPPIVPVRPQKF